VLSVSTAVAGATGASITAGRDSAFHRGAPWAAPSAPSGAQEQADTIHPLLRDALFASPLTRSALPSVTYNSYGYESYAGTSMSGASAGGSTEHAPAPSPVATAAPPQG
jgi:hypothetical protein